MKSGSGLRLSQPGAKTEMARTPEFLLNVYEWIFMWSAPLTYLSLITPGHRRPHYDNYPSNTLHTRLGEIVSATARRRINELRTLQWSSTWIARYPLYDCPCSQVYSLCIPCGTRLSLRTIFSPACHILQPRNLHSMTCCMCILSYNPLPGARLERVRVRWLYELALETKRMIRDSEDLFSRSQFFDDELGRKRKHRAHGRLRHCMPLLLQTTFLVSVLWTVGMAKMATHVNSHGSCYDERDRILTSSRIFYLITWARHASQFSLRPLR